MGASFDSTGRKIFGATLLLIVALMLSMTTCNSRRAALAIDGFSLSKTTGLTVGRGGDIAFSRLPAGQMTVSLADDGLSWDITVAHTDTLPYYKVNEANPNKHALDDADVIEVALGGKRVKVDVATLRQSGALAGHHSQYVLLADALRRHDAKLNKADVAAVRSFLFRTESDHRSDKAVWHLVILDEATRLCHGQATVGYAFSYNTGAQAAIDGAVPCKLQFWQMSRSTYRQPKADDYFTLDSVNVVAKPSLIATDWGAGHVMLRADGDKTTVSFPKPITYVERLDTLRAWAAPFAGLLTLSQAGSEFPSPCGMLVPAFSGSLNSELCNLIAGEDTPTLRAPDGSETPLHGALLTPCLQPVNIRLAGGTVAMRAGIIDGRFALSMLWPTLLMAVVLMAAAWVIFDDRRLRKGQLTGYGHRRGTRQLVLIVLAIATAYCVAKNMIALKLSYTYPYFDKLAAVTPVNAALTLLLTFSLAVLFNHSHVYIPRERATAGRNRLAGAWTALAVTVLSLVACVVYLVTVLDPGVTPMVLDSYLPGEVFSYNPLAWNTRVGINDLHRSVPYTLSITVALTALLQIACLAGARVRLPSNIPWWGTTLALLAVITAVAATVPGNFATAIITLLVVVSLSHTSRHIMTMDAPAPRVQWVTLAVTAAVGGLLALWMLVMGLTFSRGAGVSLVTIAAAVALGGVTWVLARNCRDNDAVRSRVFRFVAMLAAAVVHFVAAVGFGAGDMGYFTNFVGFVVFVYIIYALSFKSTYLEQSGADERVANDIEKRQLGWLFAGMAVLLVVVLHVFVPNYVLDPDKVDFGRGTRRMSLSADFNNYSRSGYRYAVQDVEFMIVMDHYLNWNRGADPLSNEDKPLHPSVSGGQSPVVLNDVSLPAAFLGAWGAVAYLAYGLLLALLAWAVVHHSVPDRQSSRQSVQPLNALTVSRTASWRLLAMLMWVGTTVYLFLSYMGWLPFTGRLNPGLGVDAVGEALESAVLLAFMTACSVARSK